MKFVIVFMLLFAIVASDIMDRHSKMVGECLIMLERNIESGLLRANLTGLMVMEELCDEFVSHLVAWSN